VLKFSNTVINLLDVSAAAELVDPKLVGAADDGARVVFSVGVEDVDAECTRLVTLGVALLNGPMDRPWGLRTASFLDPSGHAWEIAHDLRSASD
jgi:uncharacterized glyoxalase superfamily protein PhnB